MINILDIFYAAGVGLSSPYWLIKPTARIKVLGALKQRMGHTAIRQGEQPAIMIHAVSLGEINATRALIEMLRQQRPGLRFIVSVTTQTGFSRGRDLYGSAADVVLVRYPLDFSWAIQRMLKALRPALVALVELEVWPNFIKACRRSDIPVLLINGRVTPHSFHRYKVVKPLLGWMFRQLTHVAVQDATYQRRFIELGAAPDRVSITGTMKFDTARVADHVDGQEELARAVGLGGGQRPVWLCASTGPGEEQIILEQYLLLIQRHPNLRLVIVPRKPERFDEVARLIESTNFPLVRRSRGMASPAAGIKPIILGDTIGELGKFYALADVVFVGRTLVDLGSRQHGSDMIEPAALAKPVIVGPFTGNFAEAMEHFRADNAMRLAGDGPALGCAVDELLNDPMSAQAMGQRAREVVKREQGATARHVELILRTLESRRK